MKRRDSTLAIMREPFAAGLDEKFISNHAPSMEAGRRSHLFLP